MVLKVVNDFLIGSKTELEVRGMGALFLKLLLAGEISDFWLKTCRSSGVYMIKLVIILARPKRAKEAPLSTPL